MQFTSPPPGAPKNSPIGVFKSIKSIVGLVTRTSSPRTACRQLIARVRCARLRLPPTFLPGVCFAALPCERASTPLTGCGRQARACMRGRPACHATSTGAAGAHAWSRQLDAGASPPTGLHCCMSRAVQLQPSACTPATSLGTGAACAPGPRGPPPRHAMLLTPHAGALLLCYTPACARKLRGMNPLLPENKTASKRSGASRWPQCHCGRAQGARAAGRSQALNLTKTCCRAASQLGPPAGLLPGGLGCAAMRHAWLDAGAVERRGKPVLCAW